MKVLVISSPADDQEDVEFARALIKQWLGAFERWKAVQVTKIEEPPTEPE